MKIKTEKRTFTVDVTPEQFFEAFYRVQREFSAEHLPLYNRFIRRLAEELKIYPKWAEQILWNLIYYTDFKERIWAFPAFKGRPGWTKNKEFYKYICSLSIHSAFGWDTFACQGKPPSREDIEKWTKQFNEKLEVR